MHNQSMEFGERFREKQEPIKALMDKDPKFSSLCEDYQACVHAYQYWSGSKEPEAGTRQSEYWTLIQELEQEIEDALQPLA